MHKDLKEMEQYSDDQFVVKGVCKGAQSEAVLLFLRPGGVIAVNGEKDVALVPETLYYEPAGYTFRIRNTGKSFLQVLITLVRVEA